MSYLRQLHGIHLTETVSVMISGRPRILKIISFTGIAAHAARFPEKGRSALDAAELMNVGVNYLREHVAV